jgi:DUF1680 family protein
VKYLALSKYFLDWRGDSTTHRLFGPYSQDHIPVTQQDECVGHAVRAMYMVAAMTDIAAIYDDQAYRQAVEKLWENMVNKKMYITGGIGARHEGESFGDNYELPNLTAYNETCAAIGSVYWNHRLFLLSGDVKYYDILERTLYNGLIAGISLDGTKFFYPNPLSSDGKYAFNQGACTRQGWFDCSCCPTNLIRFIPSIPGLIYAVKGDTLFVNLYVSNKARIEVGKNGIEIIQQKDFPWEYEMKMVVNPDKAKEFTIRLRIPYWAGNDAVPGDLYEYTGKQSGRVAVSINGKEIDAVQDNGYISIGRTWNKGDEILLSLPMEVKHVITNDTVSENHNHLAFEYGPLVYCAEEIDNPQGIDDILLDQNEIFSPEYKKDLLNGINILTGQAYLDNGKAAGMVKQDRKATVVLVPYYAWSNRGVGKMKVWLPVMTEGKQ